MGVFFVMNVSVPIFYSAEVLYVWSVCDLLLLKYRVFLVLASTKSAEKLHDFGFQEGSLNRSSSCASIRCSAQICQAILTRVARQPASSHKHLTVFVSKSTVLREEYHKNESVGLCKATTT